jgi:hypothetical protein
MEEDYLSVKEFAGRARVSPQAVYQRLDKDLKDYFKLIEGKKAINIAALDLFGIVQEAQSIEQPIEQILSDDLTTTLKETLKVLSQQLDKKDRQINELNERLKESNELNRNNQILIGRQQEQPKQLEENSEVKEAEKRNFWSWFKKQ